MSVHITPQMRAKQFPGELKVVGSELLCSWCDRVMNHNRKDAIIDHLRSKSHQENRVTKGARITFNSKDTMTRKEGRNLFRRQKEEYDSKDAMTGKEGRNFFRRKKEEYDSKDTMTRKEGRNLFRRKKEEYDSKDTMTKKEGRNLFRRKKEEDLHQTDDTGDEECNVTANLRKLFQDSDSDSETSFEGFDCPPGSRQVRVRPRPSLGLTDEDDSRRSGRPRKRPARLSDSFADKSMPTIGKVADQAAFVSTMAKKHRASEEDSSSSSSPDLSPPARIRTMPIKKQISFSARQSDSLSPTSSSPSGSLKMKFSRTTAKKSKQEYIVKPDKNLKVVSKSGPGKGLKLKFVWKKKQHSKGNDSKYSSTSDGENTDDLHNSEETSQFEQMLKGIEGPREEEEKTASQSFEEIVEEEIVEMKEEEVVPDEDWVRPENLVVEEEENKVIEDVKSTPVPKPRARAAKPVPTQLKPVPTQLEPVSKKTIPLKTKKVIPVQYDKKRKMTGYMLWAKQMREKVSRQYPGLEFGDVSKKLGDLWKRMPDKEKEMWKFRNIKMGKNEQSRATYVRKSGSKMIETGPKKKPPPIKHNVAPASPPVKNPEAAMRQELSRLPPPSIESLDSAAYLALLGESFNKLSAKTRKIETQTVIKGAESVLLDSLVCALAPLISLTRQIPELNDAIDQKTLSNCFSNIAHVMPGL